MAHMATKPTIADIVALPMTNLEDGILLFARAEGVWLTLDKTISLLSPNVNQKTCWWTMDVGGWFLCGGQTVTAHTSPTGLALPNVTWIFQEDPNTQPEGSYTPLDKSKSIITYYAKNRPYGNSFVTDWHEQSAQLRQGEGDPNLLGITCNSLGELWKDILSGELYTPLSVGSSTWVAIGGTYIPPSSNN